MGSEKWRAWNTTAAFCPSAPGSSRPQVAAQRQHRAPWRPRPATAGGSRLPPSPPARQRRARSSSRFSAPAAWRCSLPGQAAQSPAVPRPAIFCNDCHTAGGMSLPRRSEHYHPIVSVQPPLRLIQLFEQARTSQNDCSPVTPGMGQQYQQPNGDSRAAELNNGKKSSYWFPNFNPISN